MTRYEVRNLHGKAWGVFRIGPRGGVKHVATYPWTDEAVAESVARELNAWADREL